MTDTPEITPISDVRGAADYYLTTRLRSSPEEQQRYCKPLAAQA